MRPFCAAFRLFRGGFRCVERCSLRRSAPRIQGKHVKPNRYTLNGENKPQATDLQVCARVHAPSQKRRRISCAPIGGVVDNPAILAPARCRTRTGNGTNSAPNIRRTEGVSFYAPSLSRFLRFSSNMGIKHVCSQFTAISLGALSIISHNACPSSSRVISSSGFNCWTLLFIKASIFMCQNMTRYFGILSLYSDYTRF